MKFLTVGLVSCLLNSILLAETWAVNDDGKAGFDNIQAAIDAASDGDEIVQEVDRVLYVPHIVHHSGPPPLGGGGHCSTSTSLGTAIKQFYEIIFIC